jgi:hypothetical protein
MLEWQKQIRKQASKQACLLPNLLLNEAAVKASMIKSITNLQRLVNCTVTVLKPLWTELT